MRGNSNANLNAKIVKQGDSIDLGGKTLEFIPSPFLHWPDSMFTYLPEDKVLFSCDMFGCHYCEPRTFDYLTADKEAYDDAFCTTILPSFPRLSRMCLPESQRWKGWKRNLSVPATVPC